MERTFVELPVFSKESFPIPDQILDRLYVRFSGPCQSSRRIEALSASLSCHVGYLQLLLSEELRREVE